MAAEGSSIKAAKKPARLKGYKSFDGEGHSEDELDEDDLQRSATGE